MFIRVNWGGLFVILFSDFKQHLKDNKSKINKHGQPKMCIHHYSDLEEEYLIIFLQTTRQIQAANIRSFSGVYGKKGVDGFDNVTQNMLI